MPRIVDYPRASLSAALALAKTVDTLGGTATEESVAEATGKAAKGGGFKGLVAAAVKFGFIENRKGSLTVAPLFKDYKHGYDEGQRTDALRRSFLGVPLFRKVHERFVGKQLPHQYLDKLLIREFDVPEDLASRLRDYFVSGAKGARLINDAGTVLPAAGGSPADQGAPPIFGLDEPDAPLDDDDAGDDQGAAAHYVVKVVGPGVNSTIAVRDPDDLAIVDIILKKVRNALAVAGEVAGRE